MKIDNYHTYTIKSSLPGGPGYVHIPFLKADGGWLFCYTTAFTMIWAKGNIEVTQGAADFLFIEADDDPTYYIVNRRSGLCLGMAASHDATPLIQAPYDPDRDSAFRFVIEPVGNSVQLESCLDGRVVVVAGGQATHGAALQLWDPATPSIGASNRFELTQVDSPPRAPSEVPQLAPWKSVRPAQRPRRVKSLTAECEQVETTSVAADILPFFMVNDPAYSVRRQVEESPFYEFTHKVGWAMVRDRVFDGHSKETTTERTSIGMSRYFAASLEHTVKTVKQTSFGAGIDPEIEAKGVKAKGISAKFGVSKTASRETSLAIHTSAEGRTERSISKEVEYPAPGYRYRIVTWRPMDLFELRRADGDLVDFWMSIRDDQEYVDVYPEKVPAKAKTKKTTATTKKKAQSG